MKRRREDDRIVDELERIYADATEETISADLTQARRIVNGLPEDEQVQAKPLLEALERIEFWLHDR